MVTKKQKRWIETGIVMGAGALVLSGLILSAKGKPDMGDDVVTPPADITNNYANITTRANVEASDAMVIGMVFDMEFHYPVSSFNFWTRGTIRVIDNPSTGWASYVLNPVFASTNPVTKFSYSLNEPRVDSATAKSIHGLCDVWTLIGMFRDVEMPQLMNGVTISAKLRVITTDGIIKDYALWRNIFSISK